MSTEEDKILIEILNIFNDFEDFKRHVLKLKVREFTDRINRCKTEISMHPNILDQKELPYVQAKLNEMRYNVFMSILDKKDCN